MSERHRDGSNRQSSSYSRRRFLATTGIAATVGIAGCSGGGDGGADDGSGAETDGSSGDGESDGGSEAETDGSSGDGESDDGSGEETDGSSGDGESDGSDGSDSAGNGGQNCRDFWSGYLRFEPGERAFTYSCDYPEVFGEQSDATPGFDEYQEGLFIAEVEPDSQSWDYFQLNLQQTSNGTTEAQATFGETWESLTQTEFNGETRTAYLYTADARSVTTCGIYLPYEVDGRTLYFETKFVLRANVPDSEEISRSCIEHMEETATHMLESLTPNPDATGLGAGLFVPTTTSESN